MIRSTRLALFCFGFCFVLFWLEEVSVKLKPWCIEGFVEAHSQWVGLKNESVTMPFSGDTCRQAFGPLITATHPHPRLHRGLLADKAPS